MKPFEPFHKNLHPTHKYSFCVSGFDAQGRLFEESQWTAPICVGPATTLPDYPFKLLSMISPPKCHSFENFKRRHLTTDPPLPDGLPLHLQLGWLKDLSQASQTPLEDGDYVLKVFFGNNADEADNAENKTFRREEKSFGKMTFKTHFVADK